MNSVFEANSLVVKLARVYPPEAAPKATRAVLGNLFEEALTTNKIHTTKVVNSNNFRLCQVLF